MYLLNTLRKNGLYGRESADNIRQENIGNDMTLQAAGVKFVINTETTPINWQHFEWQTIVQLVSKLQPSAVYLISTHFMN